jgi:hypothetical protein
MAGREARSRSQKPLQSGFWLKPDPSAAFEAAEAAPRSRARSRLLTSPNERSPDRERRHSHPRYNTDRPYLRPNDDGDLCFRQYCFLTPSHSRSELRGTIYSGDHLLVSLATTISFCLLLLAFASSASSVVVSLYQHARNDSCGCVSYCASGDQDVHTAHQKKDAQTRELE